MACDGYMRLGEYYISGVDVKANSLDVGLPIVIKIACFRVSVVIWPTAPYLQFVAANYIINWSSLEYALRKGIGGGHGH